MFDASFKELLLILIVGLLVLGPERLPKVAAELGKWVARARRTATQLRRQLEREIELEDALQQKREREQRSRSSESPQAGGNPSANPTTDEWMGVAPAPEAAPPAGVTAAAQQSQPAAPSATVPDVPQSSPPTPSTADPKPRIGADVAAAPTRAEPADAAAAASRDDTRIAR